MSQAPVITLDGPSATGKGTIARAVAEKLGFHLLDSGALYRVLALAASKRRIDPENGAAIAALAPRLALEFAADGGVVLDGESVGTEIRTARVDELASRAAALPEVRRALLPWQRGFRRAPGLVAEGRDMGAVVFPDAARKFFLTASAEIRAERRCRQLLAKGLNARLADLSRDLQARDRRDRRRSISPLRPVSGAVEIDTSQLTVNEVVDQVMRAIGAEKMSSAAPASTGCGRT